MLFIDPYRNEETMLIMMAPLKTVNKVLLRWTLIIAGSETKLVPKCATRITIPNNL